MRNLIKSYTRWLHTRFPAGHVEKLPVTDELGRTNVRGLYIAGDLRGVPLLKFAADSGARVVQEIDAELRNDPGRSANVVDVAIVGAGVAGMAAALEARRRSLSFVILEASEPFSTIVNFPRQKPIFTYPRDMTPAGDLSVTAAVKEELLEELRAQTVDAGIVVTPGHVESVRRLGDAFEVTVAGKETVRARRVVCAPGRSGNFRKLGVPGENLDKVYNRLHDPRDFAGAKALVVGGGDSAMETAIALAQCGANVTISYRKESFNRPKPENVQMLDAIAARSDAPISLTSPSSERVTTASGEFMGESVARGTVRTLLHSSVKEIREKEVVLETAAGPETVGNDVVFLMIGREAPLEFFRKAGVAISGEWTRRSAAGFAAFVVFCVALYNWKSGGMLSNLTYTHHAWPVSLKDTFAAFVSPGTLLGIVLTSASTPSFWYTLAYSALVVVFGVRRIRRRKTPYITLQTTVLMSIQVIPLFLLPEILLPWMAHHGWLPSGLLDALFPVANYGHGREYWRAYGLVLAWPLNVYNVFTSQPLGWWLGIAFAQTFVLIPALVYFWGKGAYCGWICSCGALAETLGDTQRTKMVHGPRWNRLNMAGQGILAIAFVMLIFRIIGWVQPEGSFINQHFSGALDKWKWLVDVFLAGVIGYGFYFWYSGRVWCRFFCPLAALMNIYSRFSRFRIIADKKKCISCNVCTSVCHQGIDIMNFANKGLPMNDPECVRCSACVQSCPTGVLTFAQVGRDGTVIRTDRLAASPVQMRET